MVAILFPWKLSLHLLTIRCTEKQQTNKDTAMVPQEDCWEKSQQGWPLGGPWKKRSQLGKKGTKKGEEKWIRSKRKVR
jgi:hypothetical protein